MPRVAAPFVIEVTRGSAVESRHLVSAAVADADGCVHGAWGEIDQPIFPRSAIKPLQALPLLLSGAADAFGVRPIELALAAGSQIGTARHIEVAEAFRGRIGAELGTIACGAHTPYDAASERLMIRRDDRPTVLHNNCIGKHLGMIATARHLREPVEGYVAPDHPVQRRVLALLETLGGQSLVGMPVGIDGCSAPTFAMPLLALARAFARFGAADALDPALASACRRVGAAMAAEPEMVGGAGKLSSEVIRLSGGAILLKEGAGGVAAAAIPGKGLGLALKVADGAGRAAETAMLALLRYFGAISHEMQRALEPRFAPALKNWRGVAVGEIRPAGGWLPGTGG